MHIWYFFNMIFIRYKLCQNLDFLYSLVKNKSKLYWKINQYFGCNINALILVCLAYSLVYRQFILFSMFSINLQFTEIDITHSTYSIWCTIVWVMSLMSIGSKSQPNLWFQIFNSNWSGSVSYVIIIYSNERIFIRHTNFPLRILILKRKKTQQDETWKSFLVLQMLNFIYFKNGKKIAQSLKKKPF